MVTILQIKIFQFVSEIFLFLPLPNVVTNYVGNMNHMFSLSYVAILTVMMGFIMDKWIRYKIVFYRITGCKICQPNDTVRMLLRYG